MSQPLPGMSSPRLEPGGVCDGPSLLVFDSALRRVLRFAGADIDDVLDCPITRRVVRHYYKVGKTMQRVSERYELEQQWNPLGRSG